MEYMYIVVILIHILNNSQSDQNTPRPIAETIKEPITRPLYLHVLWTSTEYGVRKVSSSVVCVLLYDSLPPTYLFDQWSFSRN